YSNRIRVLLPAAAASSRPFTDGAHEIRWVLPSGGGELPYTGTRQGNGEHSSIFKGIARYAVILLDESAMCLPFFVISCMCWRS
ncbi:unnamed protein product, partial [Urochloa humidicola]